jgi:hypothetical protein
VVESTATVTIIVECVPSTILTASANPAGPVDAGTEVTFTFEETNDGQVPLTSPSVETDLAGCTLAFVSGDDNTNAILDPGETWVFECTVTLEETTTVVATAHGIDPTGLDVTFCETPGTAPEGVFCDQDERAEVTVEVLEVFAGCTPGFWKNHSDLWQDFAPDDTLAGAGFVFPASLSDFSDDTLLEALNYGGGSGTAGAARILLRAAVASLLNADHDDVNFAMTEAEILEAVNEALATEDRATILALATELDQLNNTGCSIDAHGNPIS